VDTLAWLLDSDPAIRWQTLRDLTDASPTEIAAERARVAHEGLGAAILACQGSDGSWHRRDSPDWLPTLFTLQLLRSTGVDRTDPAVKSAIARLEAGYRWDQEFGAKPFFEGEVEPCINGGALAIGSYFGHPTETLARRLIGEQLADGGWNCEARQRAGVRLTTPPSACSRDCLSTSGRPGLRRKSQPRDDAAKNICSNAACFAAAPPVRRPIRIPRASVPSALPLRRAARTELLSRHRHSARCAYL
jgi:hypothetical protein